MSGLFKKHVVDASPLLSAVVSSHLLIESFLAELMGRQVKRPDVLINELRPGFWQLVVLAQAHGLIADDLADVLKKLNSIRNKFSHNLGYHPDTDTIQNFLNALREMDDAFYMSRVPANERELTNAVSALCGFMERKVKLG